MQKQTILITGSEGIIGRILAEALKEEHDLVLLDKKISAPIRVDLLMEDFMSYFRDVETTIHLAANPSPFLALTEAAKNLKITKRVLEACRKSKVKRIIYVSSINVYPYDEIYKAGGMISRQTPLQPRKWGENNVSYYRLSKIKSEHLVNSYHKNYGISGLNLRLGSVTPQNTPFDNEKADYAIWLSHKDLVEIMKRAIQFDGLASLVCVSNNSDKLVDLTALKEILRYIPKSNSEDYRNE